MDYADLLSLGEHALRERLAEERKTARTLRFEAHERQLKAVHRLRETRKTIARILTLLRAKAGQR